MTGRQRATLVFIGNEQELVEWSKMAANDSRIITVWNLNLLKDSLHLAQSFLDVEVVRVIFDRSVDAEEWLEFLTTMPAGFRGDVLYVAKEKKGYLSAVGRTDERVMYKLKPQDLDFYLDVCGVTPCEEIVYAGEAASPYGIRHSLTLTESSRVH